MDSGAGVLLRIMLGDISDSFILSSFLRLVIFYISGDSGRNLEKTEFSQVDLQKENNSANKRTRGHWLFV